MGYTRDVVKGFSWLGGFRVVTRVLSFVRTAITARLLSPSQVGVFGIATIVLSLMEIMTETGINIFLTQKKDDVDEYIATAWLTSIIRGIIISFVIYVAAPLIASFYGITDSVGVLKLIALVPILRGFINPSVVKFTKELSFHKEFYYRTTIFLVETVVSILLLFLNPSPVSLVWGFVSGAAFEVVLSFSLTRPLPEFSFKYSLFREVISRGKYLTFTGIFSYLYHNGDDLIVGKLLGTAPLGLYQMAYKISMLPITEGSDVVGGALFPVLVKMSDDKVRLRRAYLKALLFMAMIVVPMSVVFLLFPELIITLLLGDKWLPAVPVLRVLAIFGSLRALSISVIYPIYALNKQEYVTVISLVALVGMLTTIYPFIHLWGLTGAAFSALFGTLLSLPVSIYYVLKLFR